MEWTREHRLIVLLLLVLTFAVFAQVGNHEFVVFDDQKFIVNNPDVSHGLSLEAIARVFTNPHNGDFIPLTYVTLQIDRTLFGPEASGTLLVNVALHATSAVLLFLTLAQMTGTTWRSAFVAAVFAVHPMHVESVAWAFERKDALSGLFWMLSLFFYARRAAGPGRNGSLLPVAACMFAGLLSKPVLVTLPIALILLDYWPLGRLRGDGQSAWPDPSKLGEAVREKWLLFAIVAAASLFTIARHSSSNSLPEEFRVPFDVRLMYVPISYVFYLWKSLWPTALAVYYPYPYPPATAPAPVAQAALALLPLLAMTALALRLGKRAPYLLAGWLWYLATLLPVIGIVQVGVHVYADRYNYIPQIGLAWMVAWRAAEALGGSRVARRCLSGAAAAAVLALAFGSWLQVRHWQNTITLFERVVDVAPDDHYAHWRLAMIYAWKGRKQDAIEHYRHAVSLQPDVADLRFELARVLEDVGQSEAAMPNYARAVALDPDLTDANMRYGVLLVARGRYEQAVPLLESAVESEPELPRAHVALAQAYAELGRDRDAARHYREGLRQEPDYPAAVNNFAMLLSNTSDETLRDPEEAISLVEGLTRDVSSPEPAVLDTLANAHAAAGDLEQAVRVALRAEELAAARGNDALRREIDRNLERYRDALRASRTKKSAFEVRERPR